LFLTAQALAAVELPGSCTLCDSAELTSLSDTLALRHD
jgi:hypothetical protein